jgi:hypothetical protein
MGRLFACNGAVPVPGRIPGTLEVLERGSARSIYSTPLRGSSLSITHIFGWTTAGNHRHGTDGHMDFDTCALSSETALERPGHSCQFHIDHISAAELTRETSHMPVVPHGCTPEALQHPPYGCTPTRSPARRRSRDVHRSRHARGRSTTDTHHASLLLQLRLQFYLATSAHYRMDLDTRSYA